MPDESKFRQATPKYAALQQSSVFLETEPKSCEVEHAGEIRARSATGMTLCWPGLNLAVPLQGG